MFTEPKRGNGLNESPTCYATKQLWAIVCYYEIYEDINFKYFIEHIEHFIEKYHFDWPKNKPYPKYNNARKWPKKYDYQECVQCYENKKLNFNSEKANAIHDKKYFTDTVSDFKHYDRYDKLIDEELSKEEPDVNRLERLENLKDKAYARSTKRSGRDVQKFEGNIKGNVKTENINLTMKTTAEVLDENADTIERFIERRMHQSDKSAD